MRALLGKIAARFSSKREFYANQAIIQQTATILRQHVKIEQLINKQNILEDRISFLERRIAPPNPIGTRIGGRRAKS